MLDFIDYLKNNLVLNDFIILQTNFNSAIIFKSFSKYSKCIYLNFDNDTLYVTVDKVFDSKQYYLNIERLLISKAVFKNMYDSFDYIQKNIEKKAI